MNKKYVSLLSFILVLTACSGTGERSSNSETNENKYEGTVLVNPFETIDDLYSVRQMLPEITYRSETVIDLSKEQTYAGENALKIHYNNSTFGQIYQRFALTNIADCDVSNIKNFSIWFYNANANEIDVEMNVVGKEAAVLSTYTESLKSGEWQKITYEINKVALDAMKDNVRGVSFNFVKNNQCTYPLEFYVDNLEVTFGAAKTSQDEQYLTIVNEIVNDINELPDTVSASDTESIAKCKDIAKRYSALPAIYQPAVSNYDIFQLVLQSYIDSVADKSATDSEVTVFHFDSCFGLAQASFSYNMDVFGIGIDEEKHLENEESSLKLTLNREDTWLEFYANSSVNMQDYDYLEFSVFNDCSRQIAFCLTWDTAHYVNPGEWVAFKVSTDYANFKPTYLIEWEFTEITETGGNAAPEGNIYISKVRATRASAQSFVDLLNDIPDSISENDRDLLLSIRDYYENLHKDEKAKVTAEQLQILTNAEKALKASLYPSLGAKIDAIPTKTSINAKDFDNISLCYEIYSSMSENEKSQYLTKAQVSAIVEKYEYASQHFALVLSSNSFVGNSIGSAWDIRCNSVSKTDSQYGQIAEMTVNNIEGANNGAFEFTFNKINCKEFNNVTFYFYSSVSVTLYVSRSGWRGGDGGLGFISSFSVTGGSWSEITLSGEDFSSACAISLYFTKEAVLGDVYKISSIYGIK